MALIQIGKRPHALLVVGIDGVVGSVESAELSRHLAVVLRFAERVVDRELAPMLQALANIQHEAVVQRVHGAAASENRAGGVQAVGGWYKTAP